MVTDDEHVNYPILVVFLDQFIAILKVLSENVHSLAEDLRVIDIPTTLYTLATFINRVEDTDAASVRLKVKFCALCTSVFSRTEPVMMRNKESNMRQSIADIIVDWVQDVHEDGQVSMVQHELNVSVLKAAVTLFDRLQLEPSDGTTGEDVAHAVSRLFIRYANFLVKTWEITRYDGNVSKTVIFPECRTLTCSFSRRTMASQSSRLCLRSVIVSRQDSFVCGTHVWIDSHPAARRRAQGTAHRWAVVPRQREYRVWCQALSHSGIRPRSH